MVKYLNDDGIEVDPPDLANPNTTATAPQPSGQQGITDPTTRVLDARNDPAGGGTGTQGGSTAPAPAAAAAPDYSTPAGISSYYASRGVSPFPTSVDYWVTQWNNWGKSDPTEFQRRLAQADEFTGVGPNYDWQAAGKADPGQAANTSPATTTAAAAPISAGAVVPQDSAFTQYLRSLIQQRLTAASTPVDPNAQNIAAPLSAARDEATRASDTERTAEAERLYAQGGLNTNALNQTIQQSAEKNAGSLSTLRGTLIMNAYNQKNQELQSLLQMALASGDAESARAVQAQIANLNAEIQREGLGVTLAINSANQNANTVNSALG